MQGWSWGAGEVRKRALGEQVLVGGRFHASRVSLVPRLFLQAWPLGILVFLPHI